MLMQTHIRFGCPTFALSELPCLMACVVDSSSFLHCFTSVMVLALAAFLIYLFIDMYGKTESEYAYRGIVNAYNLGLGDNTVGRRSHSS